MIDGVSLLPLQRHADERGAVLHMLRSDAPHFRGFGEVYFSLTFAGIIKGWHRQHAAFRYYAVPSGDIRAVLFDGREDSPSAGRIAEFSLGDSSYGLLVIPPGVWSSFRCLGPGPALVADVMSAPHDPAQAERLPIGTDQIPYEWD
jgi:dTDP-4-dehydrorhamnose 3,5-epimerase